MSLVPEGAQERAVSARWRQLATGFPFLFLGAALVGALPFESSPAASIPATGDRGVGTTQSRPVARPDGPSLTFVTRAVGVARAETPLRDRPVGGATLGILAAGAPLYVGGEVTVRTGLWPQRALWVRVDSGTGYAFGFLDKAAVSVLAGAVPALSVNADHLPAMLNPVVPPTSRRIALPVRDAGGEAVAGNEERANGKVDRSLDAAATKGIAIPWLPVTVLHWQDEIAAAARQHGLDPEFLAIIVLVESGGNPRAGSHVGARGLTQVMPATGAEVAAGLGWDDFSPSALWDPVSNLDLGAAYLATQLAAFGRADDPDFQQSIELAACAYNGGPGVVLRNRFPAETQRYRRYVGGMWRERHDASSPTLGSWIENGGWRLLDAAEVYLADG